MSENPYAPPSALLQGVPSDPDKVEAVAKAQRMLLLGILISFLGNGLMKTVPLTPLILFPIALAVSIFGIVCVYRLCQALAVGPVLWIIAMFIPLINLICLVLLNQKATTYLKSQGVSVGLMGAKL